MENILTGDLSVVDLHAPVLPFTHIVHKPYKFIYVDGPVFKILDVDVADDEKVDVLRGVGLANGCEVLSSSYDLFLGVVGQDRAERTGSCFFFWQRSRRFHSVGCSISAVVGRDGILTSLEIKTEKRFY